MAGNAPVGRHRYVNADTHISMRDYVESRFADKDIRDQQRYDAAQTALQAALSAQEKAVQAALTAAEKAVTKAEVATEKRIEGINELRRVVQDVSALQMPRAEAEQRLATMAEQIRIMTARLDTAQGRSGGASALYGYAIAAIGVVLAVVAFVTR
jgi:hypothetical protein